jgi:membrane-bound metal-dependent hydrolase YbcI (DUF457 family)
MAIDKHLLIEIAIGAAVTVSVLGGLHKWALNIFDAIIPASSASKKIKKTLSVEEHRSLFWSVFFLLFCAGLLIRFDKADPITRWSIVRGCLLVGGLFGFFARAVWDIVVIVGRRKSQQVRRQTTRSQ